VLKKARCEAGLLVGTPGSASAAGDLAARFLDL
jgi:hypothetical protein